MHFAHLALRTLAWLLALAWLFKFIETTLGLPKVANLLQPEYDRIPAGEPSLTVIVPARNEAENVGACLESLLAQDYANLRVLAVNDRSTDRTGAIMDALAAVHPKRLCVLHIAELPAGWLGKTHAMATAARQTIAEQAPGYLLFTDGDIFFRPEILRCTLAYAVASDAAHFVTMPTTIVKTRGEGMILSFLQVMSFWAVRLWRVADPKSRRDALGVGAFNLLRTSAYLELGGFDAMPMEVLEDLTLGRRVKEAGLRQGVAIAPGAVTVHWAAGLFGIVNGMTKNLFALFKFRPVFLLGAAMWFAILCLGPVALLFVPGTRLAAVLALLGIAGLYTRANRLSRISPMSAAAFPLSAAIFVYSLLRSMMVTLKNGGVEWRGTFYPLRELRKRTTAD